MIARFYTFGCKLNQAETRELKEKFKKNDAEITKADAKADSWVINACVVTQKAEREVRQMIHKIRRNFPKSLLVVTGCFTREMREKERENVDLWADNKEKQNLDKILFKKTNKKSKKIFEELKTETRSLIKIQSGCRHYCRYCVVPFLRQEIFNRLTKEIVQEIKQKEKQGYKEIVLVGTNIGSYYSEKEKSDLVGCLKEILSRTRVPRIRLSSIWPTKINDRLIYLFKDPRLCPYFHLSVQSASDKVLKRMKREYTKSDLRKVVKRLRRIPDINLTADFIVGFPGETNSDFQETKAFVKWAGFLKIHVFRFSPRSGTQAAGFKDQISERTKRIRSKELIKLGENIGRKQRTGFLGKTFSVLIESKQDSCWRGLTQNYLKVFVKSDKNLAGKIIKVKLLELYKDGIKGKIK